MAKSMRLRSNWPGKTITIGAGAVPILHHLIDKMENVSGWKSRKQKEGYGTAITECFGGTVGQVVKVSRNADGKVKIDHVWAIIDCG